ncbi:neogenin isoform X1 [Nilaparvata lugens]|uniref:neogenin isoform X1 n=1 Tax=Nilaparvata lugens TaxID=108931 RepID=UPI00193DAD90|nr:neogenin isoform X1 [Nilaparvata lugens]XP_039298872.1 neogenin isoform X1 [Nilaparvata lugens]
MIPSSVYALSEKLWPLLIVCFLVRCSAVSGDEGSQVRLSLIEEPNNVVVTEGSSKVLNCAAVSSDARQTPIIKWRVNNDPLTFIGDSHRRQLSNGSLHLMKLFSEDNEYSDGVEHYQCVASLENVGSIVSHTAKVSLARVPKFIKQPTDIRVFQGQTAHFNCLVESNSEVTRVWLKDQRPLRWDETRMFILPSGSLEIDEVRSQDRGIYQCNVSNLAGRRLSDKAILSVEDDDLELSINSMTVFIAKPRDTIAVVGSTVTLDCAANGNPQPLFVWLKNGVSLDMADLDSRFRRVGTGSLQISSVEESDTGSYQCRAGNKEDSVDAFASLRVQVPPSFIRKPADRTAREKDDIELDCQVYGIPEPKVQWLKNGEVLNVNTDYMQLVKGNNLKIMGLMAQDAGIFQCTASNPAGNIQASAHLTVLNLGYPSTPIIPDPPSFTDPIRKQEENKVPSAPSDLESVITGARFITLKWKPPKHTRGEILWYTIFYKPQDSSRERAVNTTGSKLEEVNIQGLLPDRSYHFRVVASNVVGSGLSSSPLVLRTQPEDHVDVPGPPLRLTAVATAPNELSVQWQPPMLNNGPVQRYKLFYIEADSSEQHHVVTQHTKYLLTGLNNYTEYNLWVVAINQNGQGSSGEEISARTVSTLPSKPPQNVIVEPNSSNSVIVKWEPPPKDSQNGVITGYKMKYKKKKGSKRVSSIIISADRRSYPLTSLDRSSAYQVRLWAMNVNGTGPPTDWINATTYENDLDESSVPGQPQSMKVQAGTDSLIVMWMPPVNQNIMVRGYTIGWGKGVPDVYSQVLDSEQRRAIIKPLEPNSEYVISVRANNNKGDGVPIYEHVTTTLEIPPEPNVPLMPPVGLKAIVLSPTEAIIQWIDSQTNPSDKRIYIIKTVVPHSASNPRYKYYNSTEMSYEIDDLKPSTQYEFTVKVVKGRNESPWSMVVQNTTFEAVPTTPPRDLTVVPVPDNPTMVNLNWQPPKTPNGQIKGYIVSYTTDLSNRDTDWVVENIAGDKMTATVKGLTHSTTYYFKIQAKNSKGYSPTSQTTNFTTGPGSDTRHFHEVGLNVKDGRSGLSSTTLLYILAACCLLFISGVAIGIAIVCCRRVTDAQERSKKGYMKGNASKPGQSSIKPPDLWIHHDQMELKAMEKSSQGSLDMGPRDIDTDSEPPPRHQPTNSLDKRSYSSCVGSASQPLLLPEEKTSTARRVLKPKPITLPVETQPLREPVATATPVGGPASTQSAIDPARPLYPRTQYSISRAHVTIDPNLENPYVVQSGMGAYESVPHPPSTSQTSNYGEGTTAAAGGTGSIGKLQWQLQGHPLKSIDIQVCSNQLTEDGGCFQYFSYHSA